MTNLKRNNKCLGQYFTPYEIASFMVGLISKQGRLKILDPCCGEGVFIEALLNKGFKNINALEIDNALGLKYRKYINYNSFVSEEFKNKYDVIIGNPPYIRWKNLDTKLKNELQHNSLWNDYFNSLCDYLYIFILKAIELLGEGGQLIYITPAYWLHTKHALSLRNYMIENGHFESIYHFCETPIFDQVNSSIIIFKYIKTKKYAQKKPPIDYVSYKSTVRLNEITLKHLLNKKLLKSAEYSFLDQFDQNATWTLANKQIKSELYKFENMCNVNNEKPKLPLVNTDSYIAEKNDYQCLGDIADIGNGLVSGADKAFQIPSKMKLNKHEKQAIINVVKAKDILKYVYSSKTRYIFIANRIDESVLANNYPNFYTHLNIYREILLARYNYNKDIKYWEWSFLRNYKMFSQPNPKIFVPCKERISHKNYCRFCLVDPNLYPTQDVTAIALKPGVRENIYYILAFLNSNMVFNWLKYKGLIKGGIIEFSEKPLKSIPIRLINWADKNEIVYHDRIVAKCKRLIIHRNIEDAFDIERDLSKLLYPKLIAI